MLIRRIFENIYNNSKSSTTKNILEKQMNIIELYIKSCPDSCSIADYRDYEETPLVLLLKVNTFRSTITSYNNTNTSEVINCNYIEIEQLVLRILKCMLYVNPNCGNTISHVFQYTPLHSALYHGRCYEIIKLLVDNYNTLTLLCNSNNKANKTTF